MDIQTIVSVREEELTVSCAAPRLGAARKLHISGDWHISFGFNMDKQVVVIAKWLLMHSSLWKLLDALSRIARLHDSSRLSLGRVVFVKMSIRQTGYTEGLATLIQREVFQSGPLSPRYLLSPRVLL